MKTVLISGAAGFLGSNLAHHHLLAGDRVIGIDDFCSSDPKSPHLLGLRSFEQFNLIEGDICELSDPEHVVAADRKLDIVYNMACPASPPAYQAMPVHTMMTCVVGTSNMLAIAGRYRSVFVQASTSEVYGDPETSPQNEAYRGRVNSYGPRACYDEGKRAAEALCHDYLKTYNVDARLVRIFNTFGENMDPHDGRVVSNMICQALRGDKLTIYGNGQQTRSFCYVDDLIRGIVAMGALSANPGTPINLGNPNEFTIKELAQHVIYQTKAFGGGSPREIDLTPWIEHRDMPVDDPKQRCPDITLAKKLLGWEPQIQLGEGLKKTIKYFKNVT